MPKYGREERDLNVHYFPAFPAWKQIFMIIIFAICPPEERGKKKEKNQKKSPYFSLLFKVSLRAII